MPQNRIKPGEHGRVEAKPFKKKVTKTDAKSGEKREVIETWYRCRVLLRDADGRRREVTKERRTKGEAERAAEAALAQRIDPSITGINGSTTITELASVWHQFRRDHGKARGEGPLADQTLGQYAATILDQVDPALGAVRLSELSVPLLDHALANIEHGRRQGQLSERKGGRSTAQMRAVLHSMLDHAVSRGAIPTNYVRDCAPTSRGGRRSSDDINHLDVEGALYLRHIVRREVMRAPGRVMGSPDLQELVDLLLGTGARAGEGLAVRIGDFTNLRRSDEPCLLKIAGTLVEPRKEADARDEHGNVTRKGYRYVAELHRQPYTKNGLVRTVVVPDFVREVVKERIKREGLTFKHDALLFQTANGKPISPSNLRTRLRTALHRAHDRDGKTTLNQSVAGTTFHSLRRSVGTLIAHEVSLDAARWQLGHTDPSVTFQHYVANRSVAPDVRYVLDRFFGALPEIGAVVSA